MMAMAFHLQMDGASECANQSVGQFLQILVEPNHFDWADKLPLVEFTINSIISSSTGFTPFELNFGYMPTLISRIMPMEKAKPGVRQFITQALSNLEMVHDAILESCVTQTYQANRRQRPEMPFMIGDNAYLSTKNLNLPKGRSRKLMPKFIGPYEVTKSHPTEYRDTLELPPELKAQRIHPSFHVT